MRRPSRQLPRQRRTRRRAAWARSVTDSSRTTPFSVLMMRDSHSSKWTPRGWAKRRATSNGRLYPDALPAWRFVLLLVTFIIVGVSLIVLRNRAFRCALHRPQEQRGESGVFFQRAGRSVAGLRLCRAQHLLQAPLGPPPPTPFSKYSGRATTRPSAVSTLRVATIYLQRRPDARKHQVRAPEALALQLLHPVADAPRQLPQHLAPITNGRILRAAGRQTEVDAGGESCGVLATSKTTSPSP